MDGRPFHGDLPYVSSLDSTTGGPPIHGWGCHPWMVGIYEWDGGGFNRIIQHSTQLLRLFGSTRPFVAAHRLAVLRRCLFSLPSSLVSRRR